MIHIKRKNKYKLLIILSAVMAVLIAGYFLLVNLLPEKGTGQKPPKYEQLSWEGANQRVFPEVDTSLVDYVTLQATEGVEHASYGLIQADDGAFSLWYYPDKDSTRLMEYNPDIISKDPSFNYSSLYATDSFGQGRVARFYYLRVAITTMIFTERIPLEGLSETERMSYLEEFGFMDYGDYANADDDKELGVIASYGQVDEEGKNTLTHKIWVGGRNLSENGYYVIVDGHPYIYATNNSNIGYALQPYTYYINPAVISAGLASDAAYEPYLISDYRQWKNELVSEKDTLIPEDVQVVVKGGVSLPADPDKGGLISLEESTTFHLGELKSISEYGRLISILRAQKLTGIENAGTEEERMPTLADSLYITLLTEGRALSFARNATTGAEDATLTQTYEITEILGALTETGEVTAGAIPAGATALRVKYELYKNGSAEKANAEPLYGAISLSDSRIPADWKTEVLAQSIGKVNISRLSVVFDKDNTPEIYKRTVKVYVSDIIAIFDENGKTASKITETSYVTYRYYLEINGQRQEEYRTAMDQVSKMDETNKALFLSIGGKAEGLEERIGTYVEYFDIVQDYICYRIDAIPYMIKSEEIVHFKFLNFSERDPFYGESIYENLLEDERSLYGLNNSSCENVLLHLGGAGTSTQSSNGYTGSETVAVGLTPEVMRRYGLYAYTIYYELPRGIDGLDDENTADDDMMDDYTWDKTLGFTVYISEKQADGSRYMASDLYDVVVRVEDEKLDFLEYSFVDFWARRLLVGMDIDDMENLKVEFNFDDRKGDFAFRLYTMPVEGGKSRILVLVAPGGVTYETALTEFMKQNGITPDGSREQSLAILYNKIGPEKYKDAALDGLSHIGNDYTGTYFFKELLGIMYSTMYIETYTKEEQDAILAGEYLARMTFSLKDQSFKYVYEFYRASDRRVLTKIYQESPSGERSGYVADFAISTATFKKFMGGFDALLNAREVSADTPYFD